MPTCDCGCNQVLHIQTIRWHRKGNFVPRLVTAAVKAFQSSGSDGGALQRSHQPRTSHHYFPASYRKAAECDAEAEDGVHPNEDDSNAGNGRDSPMAVDNVVDPQDDTPDDEEGQIHNALVNAREGVWFGQSHSGALSEASAGEEEEEEEEEENVEGA